RASERENLQGLIARRANERRRRTFGICHKNFEPLILSYMKNISSLRTICFITIMGLFLIPRVSFGQDVEKGQVEATGQVGIVSGIGTHGAFGGTIAGALSENVFVYGEFLYIPLGSSNVSILGVNTNVSAKGYNFDAGIHYQFRKYGSIVPYGNVGLG